MRNPVLPILVLLVTAAPLFAQKPGTELKGALGIASFLDDDEQHSLAMGGAVRHYVTRSLAIEPEFHFLRGKSQPNTQGTVRDYEFDLNVSADFLTGARVAPYVFGGVGFALHRSKTTLSYSEFPTSSPVPGNTRTAIFEVHDTHESFGGGLGVRFFLTKHLFIAPEGRLGLETLGRFTTSIGYRF